MSDNAPRTAAETRDAADASPAQSRPISPAAQRALAEAQARRGAMEQRAAERIPELGGRAGPDPVRYKDWENNGIASDF